MGNEGIQRNGDAENGGAWGNGGYPEEWSNPEAEDFENIGYHSITLPRICRELTRPSMICIKQNRFHHASNPIKSTIQIQLPHKW